MVKNGYKKATSANSFLWLNLSNITRSSFEVKWVCTRAALYSSGSSGKNCLQNTQIRFMLYIWPYEEPNLASSSSFERAHFCRKWKMFFISVICGRQSGGNDFMHKLWVCHNDQTILCLLPAITGFRLRYFFPRHCIWHYDFSVSIISDPSRCYSTTFLPYYFDDIVLVNCSGRSHAAKTNNNKAVTVSSGSLKLYWYSSTYSSLRQR